MQIRYMNYRYHEAVR